MTSSGRLRAETRAVASLAPGEVDALFGLFVRYYADVQVDSFTRDLREKKALYARFGVAEYVIVDPLERYAMRFLLGSGGYDAGTAFGGDETLHFGTLEGVEIKLWEVFELPEPGSVPVAKGPTPR